jgi:hypothetical protein
MNIGKRDIVVICKDGEKVKQFAPKALEVTTYYLNLVVKAEVSSTGEIETWSTITTRRAFEIAFLKKVGGKLFVVLMKKRRKATDRVRIKLPGGYLPDNGAVAANMQEKILCDTGIHYEDSSLITLGKVVGHAEIHTPIDLYCANNWEYKGKPRLGFEIVELPFDSAVDLAMTGKIDNDSSFSAIMKLFVLIQRSQLII